MCTNPVVVAIVAFLGKSHGLSSSDERLLILPPACRRNDVHPMIKASFDAIAQTLHNAGVQFIVVGGIAVIHHGYGRLTQDVDLVIRLEKETIRQAFAALASIGYRPALPITAEQVADPAAREMWKRDKAMRVLKFWSDRHRETPIDLFIDDPFDFSREYAASEVRETLPGLPIHIVSLATLLEMKRTAGRPQDLADIDELNLLHEGPSSYDRST
jgi:hypothetical protein